jgi:hypothetical protein
MRRRFALSSRAHAARATGSDSWGMMRFKRHARQNSCGSSAGTAQLHTA